MTFSKPYREASLKSHPSAKKCECCESKFKPKRSWQRFCSKECKKISLAAHLFIKAYLAEKANGLRALIEKLIEGKEES